MTATVCISAIPNKRARSTRAAWNYDAGGKTFDIESIYMRNRADRDLDLTNDDSWGWLKRNSERVFNDA